MTQGGGPPFQVHVLPQRLPKLTLVGTTTIFAVVAPEDRPLLRPRSSPQNFATSSAAPDRGAGELRGHLAGSQNTNRLFYNIAYVLFIISLLLLRRASQR